jgi:predicted nucleotidyltransferase
MKRLMNLFTDERLRATLMAQPYPLLFATLSGAHLYAFTSPDSDLGVRGVHILPLRAVVRLDVRRETVEESTIRAGLEIDLVTHEIREYFLPPLRG